jgi:23S rRNA (cytosine1962-C5)-methyltransferase
MQQPFDKYLMFRNRLEKVFRHLSRQANKQAIHCYRVYDHDLPDFPFIIELYEDKLYVAEYKRKHSMTESEHKNWLNECKMIMEKVLHVAEEFIFLRLRQRKEGRGGQYQKLDELKTEFIIHENELRFIVNLTDFLDTGLFLDHRITRQMVKELSDGKKVLNLFCYTGSFSVYAISGGASKVVSVDLSKTYLDWAQRNALLNFPDFHNHHLIHADVKQFLEDAAENSFDLIVMDPPTFSNSKRMDDFLDVQKDHVDLINDCMRLLSTNGILFFSTNYSKFHLEKEKINNAEIKDITKATTPFDFSGKLKRQCFRILKN